MKIFTLFFIHLFINISIISQPTFVWSYSHYHYQMQWANGVKVIIDNVNTPIVLAQVWGWEATPMLRLYKLHPQTGSVIWERGAPGNSEGKKLFIDSLNNTYISGSNKSSFYGLIPFIMKCNSAGNLIFYKVDSTQQYPMFASACVDKFGNSYVLSRYQQRFKIIKYDSSGNINWNTIYSNHDSINIPKTITTDANYNIWSAGFSQRNNNTYLTILKISSSTGTPIDTAELIMPQSIGIYDAVFDDLIFDNSMNLFIYLKFKENNVWKNRVIKFNSNLTVIWLKVDTLISNNPTPKFLLFNDGLVLKNKNIGVEKLDNNGNQLWSFNTGYIRDMKTDNGNDIYLTGTTSYNSPSSYYTCKLNSTGSLIWYINFIYSSMTDNTALSIDLDSGNYVFVHGESYASPYYSAVSTIKYSQLTGISNTNTNITDRTHLYQNYPNPFNPETKIQFDVKSHQNIKLIIFDITGKEIFDFEHASLPPGTYEYIWDAENFSSGIYFAKLIGENYSETKRMVLVK